MSADASPMKLKLVSPEGPLTRSAPNGSTSNEVALSPAREPSLEPGREPVRVTPVPTPATRQPARVPANDTQPANVRLPRPASFAERRRSRKRGGFLRLLSFLVFCILPTLVVGAYFFFVAAPQYRVEVQFAVRGNNETSLDTLGLNALPGVSRQDADSYVVQNYIRSTQVVKDALREDGVDIPALYTHDFIDPLYRLEENVPLVDFAFYWEWQSAVEFSSITGNTVFEVYAFTPEDALTIAQTVVRRAEETVNDLSLESRQKLIATAQEEVADKEASLKVANIALQTLQNTSQSLDVESLAKAETEVITQLEGELAALQARRRALSGVVNANSPSLNVLDRQIRALEAQIVQQRANIGSGEGAASGSSVASITTEFVERQLAVEFGKEAYTKALEALEAAKAEARKQQRYLAVFVPPEKPEVSRHPKPYLYTGVAFLWFLFLWMVGLFLLRTVRDHTV